MAKDEKVEWRRMRRLNGEGSIKEDKEEDSEEKDPIHNEYFHPT